MTEKRYNGWTNYETWNVALWMDNSEYGQSYWQEQAQECYDQSEADNTLTRDERAKIDLADRLRENFESESYEMLQGAHIQSSMWADLLGAALSEVNWYEIAEHYIDEVEKSEAETAE